MNNQIPGSAGNPRRYITPALLLVLLILPLLAVGCGSRTASDQLQEGKTSNELSGTSDSASAPQSAAGNTAADPLSLDRKVVQNASLSLKVADVAAAADQIIALGGAQGGYTVSSRIFRQDDKVSGRLALKVPQASLLLVLDAIAGLGEVNDKIITAQDVTEEFYDGQARLKVLQAKEARLLSLMDRAVSINEIISVENELSKTRGEIEVLSGRLQLLTNAASYSLININLEEGVPGTVQAPSGTLGKAWQGLVNSLNGVVSFLSAAVVFLVAALPWLVLLGLLAWLLGWIYRRMKARRSSAPPRPPEPSSAPGTDVLPR